MIVDSEHQNTLQFGQADPISGLMIAKDLNIPLNNSNVLFAPVQQIITPSQSDIGNIETGISVDQDVSISMKSSKLYDQINNGEQNYAKATQSRCCQCGTMMVPNQANTCIQCLKSKIDITEGISKSVQIHHCKECNRYQSPPWVACALESPQLLALCLKHVKGLKRVKMIDASFIWTEPHSRRLKIKITVQKEVMNSTNLQQTFVVEFVIANLQCDECKKTYTPHLWQSQVQVRQRVDHKRTFLFLEQLILKHNAQEKCTGFKQEGSGAGINFQFNHRSHALRFVDFISDNVCCRDKHTKQLISHDEQNADYQYKYTFIVELAPLCRDDLCILPKSLSNRLGGVGPMVLVYKISKFIHIVDIKTMQTFEIDKQTYWKDCFKAVLGRDRMSEFIVLNIENIDTDFNSSRAAVRQGFRQVQVEVARKEDFGVNDRTFIVNTHLGEVLNFNDTVLAYDLLNANISEIEDFQRNDLQLPDIIIVKKTFPKYRKRQRNRFWKLKHLEDQENKQMTDANEEANNEEQVDDEDDDKNKQNNKKKRRQKKLTKRDQRLEQNQKAVGAGKQDYELFLQDLEEDPEYRSHVNLYRDDDILKQLEAKIAGLSLEETKKEKVKKDEVNNQRVIKKGVRKTNEGKEKENESKAKTEKNKLIMKANLKSKEAIEDDGSDEDWESVEEDAPVVKLEELLGNMKIEDSDEDDEDQESQDGQQTDLKK